MELKYRIEYDSYSRYQKRTLFHRFLPYLLPLLLCTALVLMLLYSPNSYKYSGVLLPGDPAVTTEAFQQFSEAIIHEKNLPHAIGVFCETIMEVR